jgi:uncharacterized protein YcnI
MSRTPLALGSGLLAAGALALALAGASPAAAHVTIDDDTAEAGSFTLLTFKVPNESATASTSSITLTLPSDTPFAHVSYVPVPGWSAELVTTTLPEPVQVGESTLTRAVTSVTWTAEPGAEIADGQLQLFPLSLGPVPDTGSIVLPVDQAYSDGTVVSWSESGEGADHPAPVLHVGGAPAAGGAETGSAAGDGVDVLARVFGIAGLAAGAGALAFGLASRRRSGGSA